MKKFQLFFKNLTSKNDWIFIETKLKSLMCHKKTISSNYNQNTNKKLTKIGKNHQNQISIFKFYKTKLHRGRKRSWVYELSKRSCHVNWFLTKRRLKDPKMMKLRKKSKNYLRKSRNMCQFSTWNAFSGSAKHCGINFRSWHYNIVSNKLYFYKKPNWKQKNWAT